MEDKGGIYCVYAGTYNKETCKVSIQKLLYIGKATSIYDRIGENNHEHLNDWKRVLKPGQELIYTRAFLSDSDDRTRAEAAMIYYFQPPINSDGKDGFHYSDTIIETSGANAELEEEFTVYNTDI